MKYLVSADVTFFKFVPYFSTQVPSSYLRLFLFHCLCHCLHLLLLFFASVASRNYRSTCIKASSDFRYVYTHRLKFPASEPILTNPSLVDGPPPPSVSPSDLDIPIALRKSKRSCTDHPISNFVFYDQCFKYRILEIYRSVKLYTRYQISGDISQYGTKYRTSNRMSYQMKNIHVIAYINHMKLLKSLRS